MSHKSKKNKKQIKKKTYNNLILYAGIKHSPEPSELPQPSDALLQKKLKT